MTQDFSALIDWVLAGVQLHSNVYVLSLYFSTDKLMLIALMHEKYYSTFLLIYINGNHQFVKIDLEK